MSPQSTSRPLVGHHVLRGATSTESAAPALCVVVPIRNEALSVWPLVFGLRTALGTTSMEVLFVDDSDDETPAVVRGVAELMQDGRSDFRVRLLHREPARRLGGRSGAVEEGRAHTDAAFLVVMDSGLQHRPAVVAGLVDQLRGGADVVIAGSRAEQDLDALPGFFAMTRAALTAPTLNVVELAS
jgi:dolichol-phosphate mannosyltransferase